MAKEGHGLGEGHPIPRAGAQRRDGAPPSPSRPTWLSTSGTSTGLGRFAAARLAAAARGGRSVSAAPGMEHPRDDTHNTKEYIAWLITDVTSHPFGVAYSTRSDEEGFGGVYARDDDRPAFSRPTAEAHPTHPPDHDTSQVKAEKARHLKDDKHAT
ncbi:unnamed protein product [Triticum turgidum subsp. durum]|uniref:Uncharacterized protein n=1 Tax=Triticum turgidum subsp. durum TaxID=4567 RepID=A0A9R0XUV4_TRITD|nr:unnamed protein product [Triticum turgidum subsp. durum]